MPQEDKKFFPFSDTLVPDEYDGFLLINKDENMDFNSNVNMEAKNNVDGKFLCFVSDGSGHAIHFQICHVFTIIDKDEGVNGDWKEKCPTSLDSLKPLSLKGRMLVNNNYKGSFPKVFLVALKHKSSNKSDNNFVINGKNGLDNLFDMSLGFKKTTVTNGKSSVINNKIFNWYVSKKEDGSKTNKFCDKSLLNSQN